MDSSIGSLNTLSLPEINIESDWGFLSKPPSHEEVQKDAEEEIHPSSSPPNHVQQQQQATENNDIISTTGLKRALSLSRPTSNVDNIRTEVINISTSNPSHLFWVPASQHPEIAPAEFEKYVQAHGVIVRKKSAKRQSVLSMYFTANDQPQKSIEEEDNSKLIEESEDKQRKKILRRSLSLQLPPTGDYARNVPDLLVFDRNSSPFDESRALVPKGDRPLLRRGARTNFKRNSSVSPYRNSTGTVNNRKSIEEEEDNDTQPRPNSTEGITLSDQQVPDNDLSTATTPLSPVVESEEVRDLCISTRNSRNQEETPIVMTRSVSTSTATSSSRKSNWSWPFWSDDKKTAQQHTNKVEPTPTYQEGETHKSSDTTSSSKRFTLSSLFSRKSKSISHNYTSNIEKMTSHLNKQHAPKDFQLNPMLMTRLPLHVERAIYKLSHFKLANPRRPLHEQVLISNHMFWYLSIIATTTQQQQPAMDTMNHRKRLVKKKQPPKKKQQPPKRMPANFLSSAQQKSTGFVVPDNYLNPTNVKKQKSLQDSSSSSSEDDDDDTDSDDEDSFLKQDDDVPLAMYKLK